MRALAVTSPQRNASLPDVPTFDELGVKGVESAALVGLVGPAALPADVKATLQKQVAAAIHSPAISQKLIEFGVEPVGSSSADYAALLKSENARWHQLIKDLKMKGSSITLKMGSKVKSIRLVGSGDHEVDCKMDAGSFMLKACLLKKV